MFAYIISLGIQLILSLRNRNLFSSKIFISENYIVLIRKSFLEHIHFLSRGLQGSTSWRSMENCSRPNSVSSSNLEQGFNPQVASRDMTRRSRDQMSRSQRHATCPVQNCNNSTPGGPIKFILWDKMKMPQRVTHKMVAMAKLFVYKRDHKNLH